KKFENVQNFQYLKAAISIILMIIYYNIFHFTGQFLEIKLSSSIFENLTILYISYELINITFLFFDIKSKALLQFVKGIAFVAVLIVIIIDIADKFQIDIGKTYNLWVIFKVVSLVPTSIMVYLITSNIEKLIPDKFYFVKVFLKKYHLLINFVVILLGFLWIVNIIQLSVNALIGLSILTVLILVYTFIIFYIDEFIKKDKEFYETYFPDLERRAIYVVTIIFFFLAFFSVKDLLKLDIVLNYLKHIYVVKSDVLVISLYSILKSALFYFFILNLILLAKSLIRLFNYKKTGEFIPTPIEAIVYNFGVLFATIIALSMLGITWKVLLPIIGALGIGAGFGLQSIVNNYISGFIIIFNRKIKTGDIIELPGFAGKFVGNPNDFIFGIVTEIGVINTVVETPDGVEVAIPNSRFVSEDIINYTYTSDRIRVRIPFKIGYDADYKKVEEILLKVTNEYKGLILPYPRPQVWFFEMKDYYNLFYLLFWMNAKHWRQIRLLRSNIYKRVWEEFKKEGIEVPVISIELKEMFPKREPDHIKELEEEISKEEKDNEDKKNIS
ncbi:MAG: mechanosensitive ion channel, partial [Aquificae bacterium]|nr:mechanosensitive ion channel [Aquificota bacterium]